MFKQVHNKYKVPIRKEWSDYYRMSEPIKFKYSFFDPKKSNPCTYSNKLPGDPVFDKITLEAALETGLSKRGEILGDGIALFSVSHPQRTKFIIRTWHRVLYFLRIWPRFDKRNMINGEFTSKYK